MTHQFSFLKNSEYDKSGKYDKHGNWVRDDVPMFHTTIDLDGKIYKGEVFRTIRYGKEEFILCLKNEDQNTSAPF